MLIRDKIKQLRLRTTEILEARDEKYPKTHPLWIHLPISIFMIGYTITPFFLPIMTENGFFLNMAFLAVYLPMPGFLLVMYSHYSYNVLIRKRQNPFKFYLNERKIEKDIKKIFGSVENSFKVYDKLKELSSDLSDEDFKNIETLSGRTKGKRENIKEMLDGKVDRIDLRMNYLGASPRGFVT